MRTHFKKTALALASIATIGSLPTPAQAETAGTQALSECPSGYFCVWSGTNYTGSFRKFSTGNTYLSIGLPATQSYYNRRSKRTWLHETSNGTGSSVCINPGSSKSNTTGWQQSAKGVFNASIANC